jgi:hypothetical protein
MISVRYAPAICVLIALALIPTVIHSYAGYVVTDDRTTAGIPSVLAGFSSVPSSRNAMWGKRRFDSDDWLERQYVSDGDEVVLTVVRSYDLKTLYHHPELAVAYHVSTFDSYDIRRFSQRPDVPVHVLRSATAKHPVGMYVLQYDGRFIDDPVWFQIRTSGELLFGGRKPMTLFFVHDVETADDAHLEILPAARVLFAAVDSFLGDEQAASSR